MGEPGAEVAGTAVELTPLEIACGFPFGIDEDAPPLADPPPDASPRAAFESAVMEALRNPPCFVSFSGGRDSSAVLAVAASVAKREGLDPPVPVTNVFPGIRESDESDWQERVLSHLGLAGAWRRLELGDELDLIGPIATDALRRHGVLYPANTHFHVPMLREAAGGSLLTGAGGDEAMSGRHSERVVSVLSGHARPRLGDVRPMLLWSAPAPIRRGLLRSYGRGPRFEWLTDHGRRLAIAHWAAEHAHDPRVWSRHIRYLARLRDTTLPDASFAALGEDAGVRVLHPFADAGFLAALSRVRPVLGPGDRTSSMRLLFGNVLPEPVLARRSKARFGDAFWTRYTREFTESFDGRGLEGDLVDLDRLRATWRDPEAGLATGLLIQDLWLKALD